MHLSLMDERACVHAYLSLSVQVGWLCWMGVCVRVCLGLCVWLGVCVSVVSLVLDSMAVAQQAAQRRRL